MYRNDTTAPWNRQTPLCPQPEHVGRGHINGRQNCVENLRERHQSQRSRSPQGDRGAGGAVVRALRVDSKKDFASLVLLVAFDDREKAGAFEEDCNKQPLLRVLEGVPNGARRFN